MQHNTELNYMTETYWQGVVLTEGKTEVFRNENVTYWTFFQKANVSLMNSVVSTFQNFLYSNPILILGQDWYSVPIPILFLATVQRSVPIRFTIQGVLGSILRSREPLDRSSNPGTRLNQSFDRAKLPKKDIICPPWWKWCLLMVKGPTQSVKVKKVTNVWKFCSRFLCLIYKDSILLYCYTKLWVIIFSYTKLYIVGQS